ncbi:MAG: hypothetical protein JRN39_07755, partial [Nitrososphaerota archaeon]|nr:hypothetical protein [Nitrososphaerota archaeon]
MLFYLFEREQVPEYRRADFALPSWSYFLERSLDRMSREWDVVEGQFLSYQPPVGHDLLSL